MSVLSGFLGVLQKPSLFEKIRNLALLRERIRFADSTVTREMLYSVRAEIDHRLNLRKGTKWALLKCKKICIVSTFKKMLLLMLSRLFFSCLSFLSSKIFILFYENHVFLVTVKNPSVNIYNANSIMYK